MSDISKEQKQKFKELSDKKKQIIEELLGLNYRLDTFRASLTLLINNIYSNKHLTVIPDFDYLAASKLVNDFGALLIGAEKDYYFKNSGASVSAETAKKETYDSFGGVYPSDYANPNSKNYEGDK